MLYEIYTIKADGLGRFVDGGVWLQGETDNKSLAMALARKRGGFVFRTSDGFTWTEKSGCWKAPDQAYKGG